MTDQLRIGKDDTAFSLQFINDDLPIINDDLPIVGELKFVQGWPPMFEGDPPKSFEILLDLIEEKIASRLIEEIRRTKL